MSVIKLRKNKKRQSNPFGFKSEASIVRLNSSYRGVKLNADQARLERIRRGLEQINTLNTERLEKIEMSERDELFSKLDDVIETIIDQYDESWADYGLESYANLIDDVDADEIIKQFEDNCTHECRGRFGELSMEEIISTIKAHGYDRDDIARLIIDHSEAEACNDIYIQWNEIFSVTIGEYEHQIDFEYHEDLTDIIKTMSPRDIQLYEKKSGFDLSGDYEHVCGRPCERVIFKLDVESFMAEFADIVDNKKKA